MNGRVGEEEKGRRKNSQCYSVTTLCYSVLKGFSSLIPFQKIEQFAVQFMTVPVGIIYIRAS